MNLGQRVPVGVGVVLKRDGHVLLGKRKGAHGAGQLALPGGKPDAGESPIDAAKRELFEETGIKVPYFRTLPLWTYDRFQKEGLHYVTLYFVALCPPDATAVLREPEKCEGWQWIDPRDLWTNDLFVGAAQAISEAFDTHISTRRYTGPGEWEIA